MDTGSARRIVGNVIVFIAVVAALLAILPIMALGLLWWKLDQAKTQYQTHCGPTRCITTLHHADPPDVSTVGDGYVFWDDREHPLSSLPDSCLFIGPSGYGVSWQDGDTLLVETHDGWKLVGDGPRGFTVLVTYLDRMSLRTVTRAFSAGRPRP